MKPSELRVGGIYEMKGGGLRRVVAFGEEPKPLWMLKKQYNGSLARATVEWENAGLLHKSERRNSGVMLASSFAACVLREFSPLDTFTAAELAAMDFGEEVKP